MISRISIGWFLGSSPCIIFRGVRGGKKLWAKYRHEVGESHSYTVGEESWGFSIFRVAGSDLGWVAFIGSYGCWNTVQIWNHPIRWIFHCEWLWEPYTSKQIQTIRKTSLLMISFNFTSTISKKVKRWCDARVFSTYPFFWCVNQVSILQKLRWQPMRITRLGCRNLLRTWFMKQQVIEQTCQRTNCQKQSVKVLQMHKNTPKQWHQQSLYRSFSRSYMQKNEHGTPKSWRCLEDDVPDFNEGWFFRFQPLIFQGLIFFQNHALHLHLFLKACFVWHF